MKMFFFYTPYPQKIFPVLLLIFGVLAGCGQNPASLVSASSVKSQIKDTMGVFLSLPIFFQGAMRTHAADDEIYISVETNAKFVQCRAGSASYQDCVLQNGRWNISSIPPGSKGGVFFVKASFDGMEWKEEKILVPEYEHTTILHCDLNVSSGSYNLSALRSSFQPNKTTCLDAGVSFSGDAAIADVAPENWST